MTNSNYDYIDDCMEFLEFNKENRNDMPKTKIRFEPEEIVKLKKSHDYWEYQRLKAWSEKFRKNKLKYQGEAFKYLLEN